MEVAWSPDSRRLALTSGVPPRCHFIPSRLEVMNADGSERRLLADFAASGGQVDTPRWIADGNALLFHVTHLGPGQQFGTPAGNPELYTVNVDGSDLRRIYEPAGADFQWLLSPDGERLAIFEPQTPTGWRMLLGEVDGTDMAEVAHGEGDISRASMAVPQLVARWRSAGLHRVSRATPANRLSLSSTPTAAASARFSTPMCHIAPCLVSRQQPPCYRDASGPLPRRRRPAAGHTWRWSTWRVGSPSA